MVGIHTNIHKFGNMKYTLSANFFLNLVKLLDAKTKGDI